MAANFAKLPELLRRNTTAGRSPAPPQPCYAAALGPFRVPGAVDAPGSLGPGLRPPRAAPGSGWSWPPTGQHAILTVPSATNWRRKPRNARQ